MIKDMSERKKVLLYIILAYVFSFAVRLIWVYQFADMSSFKFNGQFMINTNDGYFWAEGARDILAGFHQMHDLSPIHSAASLLTAILVKILPFSFESVIFYMSAALGSLVVIPVILIANSIKKDEMGLIAALLAAIAWSYYNRTMIGYYDTDMLNIVLPAFLLWSIILAFKTAQERYLLFAALDILVYRWWYPQSYALDFSFFGLILFYILVFDRKNIYFYKLLTIMLFAMMMTSIYIRFPIVVILYILFKDKKYDKYIFYLFFAGILGLFVSGGFSPIWGLLKGYVFKTSISSEDKGLGLHFFTVMQTIREAGHIPFELFAKRISGSVTVFFISLVGYLWLSFRHRVFLLALPMLGLGFMAYVGGLRFTIYAVPVMALGAAYVIVKISDLIKEKRLKYLFMLLGTIAVLYPNIRHVVNYKVPTVFNSSEVTVLKKLHKIAKREDYVISWWDYGYPIRYYADVKTLADGGKHGGDTNFPISFILTHPQQAAAKMARLDVEYTEKKFKIEDENKDKTKEQKRKIFSNIEMMTKDYGFNDTNDFLESLKTDIKLPKKTRDIYIYLPFRMLNIYPTIELFSNLDLMSGAKRRGHFLFQSSRFYRNKDLIDLGSGVKLLTKEGKIIIGDKIVKLHRFVQTIYGKNGVLNVKVDNIDPNSNINVIYMTNYRRILVLDDTVYNSLYIQLFILQNYDKRYFKPVVMTPFVKVYKLKI
jgi:dolichyl-diphosphooligosaccharide--protein glycosyltransferase/undecaprenyl-diphosphooligosaccharide--protein glycosyltransferase